MCLKQVASSSYSRRYQAWTRLPVSSVSAEIVSCRCLAGLSACMCTATFLAGAVRQSGQRAGLIVERLQVGGSWTFAEIVKQGDCTVVTPGSRFYIESK